MNAPRIRYTTAEGPEAISTGTIATKNQLSPREREVALLVAQGMTNREIAECLVSTEGTATLHVKHVLAKLGFRARAQIAAWAVEQGLAQR